MQLLFATLFAVLSSLVSASVDGGYILVETSNQTDVGLNVFGVKGVQNALVFTIAPENKFLLTKAIHGKDSTIAPPEGWLAGTGLFAYGIENKMRECRLKGAFTELPPLFGVVAFKIVNPAELEHLNGDDARYKDIEKCQGLTRYGIQIDCDDKTLMCEKKSQ